MTEQYTSPDLPELSDETVDRIERAVLAEIAAERHPRRSPAARTRRRGWLTATGIAAAFVAGIMIAPPILSIVGGGSLASTATGGASTIEDTGVVAPDAVAESAESARSGSAPTDAASVPREVIATAQATLQVDDIAAAVDAVADLADEFGGFVESTNVGSSSSPDGSTTEPVPPSSDHGWISIRVPSADLTAVLGALEEEGVVLSSTTSRQDVTSTAIDLRARVDATRASVQRLTELMSQSGSVSELIEAEVALTDRQAQLESYEQQLAALEDQVALSTLQVELTRAVAPTTADPAGFGDGLLAGWNGLVVSLNALVIALGFLLPWLAVAALALLLVWVVRRTARARRARRNAPVLERE